ncbi:MAG TPA: aminoglycoside phosphotransferase, partial [Nitrospirae bacterium]|nr:aminoglycoside phosphotransferase [Nitrospirota bacterium]
FSHPEWVISNICTVTGHIRARLEHDSRITSGRKWEVPGLFSAKDGKDHIVDKDNSFWRAMSFINAATFQEIRNQAHAREAGCGLGIFHSLISDLEAGRLYDTLEGFHITPEYLRLFDRALEKSNVKKRTKDFLFCADFINERRQWASVLEDAKKEEKLIIRPIHGDPKFDNIMFDDVGRAVSIIDLDTVKPGLIHYDIGDCLRSCCNNLEEDTNKTGDVYFKTDLCRAILQGYVSVAGSILNDNDYAYIYDSVRLIAFELGIRFFTDYLSGNKYFKIKKEEDNLLRALVQFRLTESIESQEQVIRAMINSLKREFDQ